MTPEQVLMAVQLFATLEPVAVKGITATIAMFQSSNLPEDQKMQMLVDLTAGLKPMELKA